MSHGKLHNCAIVASSKNDVRAMGVIPHNAIPIAAARIPDSRNSNNAIVSPVNICPNAIHQVYRCVQDINGINPFKLNRVYVTGYHDWLMRYAVYNGREITCCTVVMCAAASPPAGKVVDSGY